jgi:hypothetical protein
MPAAHASGPPIALPPAISLAHHTVLALDLGTTTGWALRGQDGGITSGTMTFRPSRFEGGGMRFLRFRGWLVEIAALSGGVARIVFEEVRRHVSTDSSHAYGGFLATLTAWCEQESIPYEGPKPGTILPPQKYTESVAGKNVKAPKEKHVIVDDPSRGTLDLDAEGVVEGHGGGCRGESDGRSVSPLLARPSSSLGGVRGERRERESRDVSDREDAAVRRKTGGGSTRQRKNGQK